MTTTSLPAEALKPRHLMPEDHQAREERIATPGTVFFSGSFDLLRTTPSSGDFGFCHRIIEMPMGFDIPQHELSDAEERRLALRSALTTRGRVYFMHRDHTLDLRRSTGNLEGYCYVILAQVAA